MKSDNNTNSAMWCSWHRKYGYDSRDRAKRAAAKWHHGDRKAVYPCDKYTGYWHIGGLPDMVRHGVAPRSEIQAA